MVSYSTTNVDFGLGTEATYICNDGYVLRGVRGDRVRTCQLDGTWTGTEPTCGKSVFVVHGHGSWRGEYERESALIFIPLPRDSIARIFDACVLTCSKVYPD